MYRFNRSDLLCSCTLRIVHENFIDTQGIYCQTYGFWSWSQPTFELMKTESRVSFLPSRGWWRDHRCFPKVHMCLVGLESPYDRMLSGAVWRVLAGWSNTTLTGGVRPPEWHLWSHSEGDIIWLSSSNTDLQPLLGFEAECEIWLHGQKRVDRPL